MKLLRVAVIAALVLIASMAAGSTSYAHNSTPEQIKAQGRKMMCPGSTAPVCKFCEWQNPNVSNSMPREGTCDVLPSAAVNSECTCKTLSGWQHGKVLGF